VTLRLEPLDQPIAPHQPGQFTMLYAFGIGEVPISISGRPDASCPARQFAAAADCGHLCM